MTRRGGQNFRNQLGQNFWNPHAVLFGLSIPRSILAFQRGVLCWQARLVAYHASFVVEYPPWSFDTEKPPGAALATAGGR